MAPRSDNAAFPSAVGTSVGSSTLFSTSPTLFSNLTQPKLIFSEPEWMRTILVSCEGKLDFLRVPREIIQRYPRFFSEKAEKFGSTWGLNVRLEELSSFQRYMRWDLVNHAAPEFDFWEPDLLASSDSSIVSLELVKSWVFGAKYQLGDFQNQALKALHKTYAIREGFSDFFPAIDYAFRNKTEKSQLRSYLAAVVFLRGPWTIQTDKDIPFEFQHALFTRIEKQVPNHKQHKVNFTGSQDRLKHLDLSQFLVGTEDSVKGFLIQKPSSPAPDAQPLKFKADRDILD